MAKCGKPCHEFDQDASNIAYSTADSLLRIWETDTARLKHEYLPSAHLSASCTCLQWRPRFNETSAAKKSKRGKSSDKSKLSSDAGEIIAIGSTTGSINLYSVSKGEVRCVLDNVHNATVTDLCWSHDGFTLFSCSADGLIAQWNVETAKCVKHWSTSKTGLSSLSLCGPSHLIAAGRSISIWNIDTQKEEKTFTGHSSDIVRIHTLYPDNEGDLSKLYIISVACDDRVISIWTPSSKSVNCKRSKASFILNTEPQYSSVYYNQDFGSLQLAVLTTEGSVEVFDHQLNGFVKKPVKPRCCLKVKTASEKSLPVLACHFKTSSQLLIMYGSEICPGFDTVNLDSYSDTDVTVLREDPSQSMSVTQVTSVGNVKQPKIDFNVTTLTPAIEGGAKPGSKKSKKSTGEKRQLEEPEMTIEQRLALLQGGQGVVHKTTGPVDSLTTLLTQALQSNDSSMLNKTLKTNDLKVINTTVRRLPATQVMPLMIHLTKCLEKYGSSGKGEAAAHTSMIKWIRAVLHIHASYLATFPELMTRLKKMYSIMENRVGQLSSYTRLQGRLELMLSQIARQKDDEKGAEASAALLTLQDESSDEEMVQDIDMLGVHSESEDGYLSADEDDLLK